MSKERVTTTVELDIYNLATMNNISFADALEYGVKALYEKKSENYEIMEGRINYLEDSLSKLSDLVNDFYSEFRKHEHDE